MEDERFDRIEFVCDKCHQPGTVTAVYVNLAEVMLEGDCPRCSIEPSTHLVNRSQVDSWLRGKAESPFLRVN